jgi:hypothetical protein
MQIICNHCGNQISFPNYQKLVTCNHCATHLQIEETETTYIASVIDEKKFDELLIPNYQRNLIQTESVALFFGKLTLEEEYTESLEENNFHSLLSGKRLRPMLLRGFYRLVVAIYTWGITQTFLPFHGSIFDIDLWSLLGFCYAIFIGIVSFRELRKWWRLWRFERNYKIDNKIVTTEIDELLTNGNPPDALRRWYKRWLDSEKELDNIKKEFYYQKIGFKIPVGPPSVSKGLRTLVMVLPIIGFVVVSASQSYYILMIIFIVLFISLLIFGFNTMGNSNNYQNVYENYLRQRKRQLKWLRDYFNNN